MKDKEKFEKTIRDLSDEINNKLIEFLDKSDSKDIKLGFIAIQLALTMTLGIYLGAIINTVEKEGPKASKIPFKNKEDIKKFFIDQTEMVLRNRFTAIENDEKVNGWVFINEPQI